MKVGSAEDFYVAHAEYVQELEDRAGVPRPCPKCGAMVVLTRYDITSAPANMWFVNCSACGRHNTDLHDDWQDAWREHERNCQAEEGEG